MTAYGRGVKEASFGRLICEIQSVNRKHLEVSVFLPKEFIRFDAQIKKWVQSAIARGQINIKFLVAFNTNSPISINVNLPLAKKIQSATQELALALGLPNSDELMLEILSKESTLFQFDDVIEDETVYLDALKEAFDIAMSGFTKIKSQAGQEIFNDIFKRLELLEKEINEIAVYAPHATKRYQEKLVERLKEFSTGVVEDERVLKEVAIFAERVDISEEITLFKDHLKRFKEVISDKQMVSIAKTLEFLLQELNREINTIGSKSSEIEVARRVIIIKSEIERVREIIQNVE